MIDLTTRYLGLKMKTPIVVSSNPLCADGDAIEKMADAGAGAVILPSLFEEQVILEETGLSQYQAFPELIPDSLKHIPNLEEYNKGVHGYLAYLRQLKNKVDIPIIASLNGSSRGGWTRYARLLEAAGADAIELNVYYLPAESYLTGQEIEERYIQLLQAVREVVKIPVAVKLSPYFSAIPNIAQRLTNAGADGLVLFNRFYQPDFDLEHRTVTSDLSLSDPTELRLRLRWVAILYDRVEADLAITGGVHSGKDVLKVLFAGANVAMVTSVLLKKGIDHIKTMLNEATTWLSEHDYESVNEIRGQMSQKQVVTPAAFERANYIQLLRSQRPKPEGKSKKVPMLRGEEGLDRA